MGDRYFCLETAISLMVEYSNGIKSIPDIQVYHACLSNYGYAVDYIVVHIFNDTRQSSDCKIMLVNLYT